MKKILLLATVCCFNAAATTAQNIGIGTPTPAGKLQINHRATLAMPTLWLYDSAIAGSPGIQFRNAGSSQYFLVSGSPGPNALNSYFDIQSSFAGTAAFTIRGDGNVGINDLNPGSKLRVVGSTSFNGPVMVEGLNLLEFGAGVVGKEVNAGKIGYNAFGTNALAIVGAGINATDRKVFFFAEGGTTFSGPINIGSALLAGGQSGSAGQVLVSNGPGIVPVWQNAALTGNTRFSVSFAQTAPATFGGSVDLVATRYNLNTTNININLTSSVITINQTGLYHFDVQVGAETILPTNPSVSYPRFSLSANIPGYGGALGLINGKIMDPTSDGRLAWRLSEICSFDLHITAPATLSVNYGFGGYLGTSCAVNGNLSGYLISD